MGLFDRARAPHPGATTTTTTTTSAPHNSTLPRTSQDAVLTNSTPRASTVVGDSHTTTHHSHTEKTATHPVTETGRKKPTFVGRLFDKLIGAHKHVDPFGPRPTLRLWLKIYWADIVTLIALGLLSLVLLMVSPLPRFKYFPVFTDTNNVSIRPGDELVYPYLASPKMKQHVPIVADALVAVFFTPILAIIIGIWRIHSFWDINNATFGTVTSVMTACAVQIILKMVVVGLRPHFYSVCNPYTPAEAAARGIFPLEGYGGLFYTVDVCQQEDKALLANAMQSFPSGHSAAAWAGLLYASYYLNGKLKPFANYHSSWWKLLIVLVPLVGATLIVGSLTLDMSHNWYDIVAGSFLGMICATLCYRMTYASILDWRWNHVPLPRGNIYQIGHKAIGRGWIGAKGYKRRQGEGIGYSVEEMAVWNGMAGTRRGGWRRSEAARGLGAPGDMAAWRRPEVRPAMATGDLERGVVPPSTNAYGEYPRERRHDDGMFHEPGYTTGDLGTARPAGYPNSHAAEMGTTSRY